MATWNAELGPYREPSNDLANSVAATINSTMNDLIKLRPTAEDVDNSDQPKEEPNRWKKLEME